RNSVGAGLSDAVHIFAGAHHNRILASSFTNNSMMWVLDTTPGNDYGAFGLLIEGDDNEVAYSEISGSIACSYDYGRDGAGVEIYGGQRNYIHHNTASNNLTFTELGNSRSADNFYAYNTVTSNIPGSSAAIT